jgi:redox-sensitive bicupin YhaK (pirin superfamily)
MIWIQVVSGQVRAGSEVLREGDALALAGEDSVTISAEEDANFLLFDLKDPSL